MHAPTAAYPLHWPIGWPRTANMDRRKNSPFQVDATKARRGLTKELALLKAGNVVISSNVPIRADGMPYADAARRVISDPGVAVYFTLKGQSVSMARDLYWRVEDNLRSVTLAISAIRAVERHGGSFMMDRAFDGFAALPPPAVTRPWWEVLGTTQNASEADVKAAYRAAAKLCHPDITGGSTDAMAELQAAYETALSTINVDPWRSA